MILLLIIAILFIIGYLVYLVLEVILNNKVRKSFKYVIHVNGIRGKSTITRLIDAGLRESGFKVFTKTTGTMPTIINTKNEDILIKRIGLANIREQIKVLKMTKKEGAEVVVLECMAVNPELQRICEEKILKANITIISNVRADHINDMGECLEDIAKAFSYTIPTNGTVICGTSDFDYIFKPMAKKKNTKFYEPYPYNGEETLDTFGENISIALRVCDILNLDKSVYFDGMRKYHHDVGAFSVYKKKDTIFLNGFSINDPDSTKIVYEEVVKKYPANELTICLNSRNDRPTRVLQHIEMMKDLPCNKLIITGSNANFIYKRIIKKYPNLNVEILQKIEDLLNEKFIFGVGNFYGLGLEIIDYFKKEE